MEMENEYKLKIVRKEKKYFRENICEQGSKLQNLKIIFFKKFIKDYYFKKLVRGEGHQMCICGTSL